MACIGSQHPTNLFFILADPPREFALGDAELTPRIEKGELGGVLRSDVDWKQIAAAMFRFRQRQAALGIGKKRKRKGVFGHGSRINFIIALRDRLGNIGECDYDPTLVAGFQLGVIHE